jgi:UDPglucose--hexose-1-phosphate uridylyltransferase
MSELRQDPITRDWVVMAPERARRPRGAPVPAQVDPALTSCPFCPGREAETPPEVWRLDGRDGGWQVRVVENRFPVLARDPGADGLPRRRTSPAGFVSTPGTGRHEVVIELPEHTGDLARATPREVRGVLEAYRARYQALRSQTEGVILIFRNHGAGAGTSLSHPHSQIIATPVVPVQIRHRFDVAIQHYDDLGTCLYLDNQDRELRDGRRIVLETAQFVVFQPFASGVPHETWIMPRAQMPSYGDMPDDALEELAQVLRAVLGGLAQVLHDPDYNLIIQSATPGDEDRPYFVWHARILPRLATPAGFELGTGMSVNPSLPEDTAPMLRAAVQAAASRT